MQSWLPAFGIGVYAILGLIVLVLTLSVLTAKPLRAAEIQYPVMIPTECVALAQRKGEPVMVESRRQAVRVKARLWMLSSKEHGVNECRDAVRRLEAEAKR